MHLQSTECQRKAWPTHKQLCALKKLKFQEGTDNDEGMAAKALHQYTHKHRYTLAYAGMLALGLRDDTSRCERELLVMTLRPQPNGGSFIVLDAEVVSFDTFFPAKQEELRSQRRLHAQDSARLGILGTFLVMLNIEGKTFGNIAPFGFSKETLASIPAQRSWKVWMIAEMNESIAQ